MRISDWSSDVCSSDLHQFVDARLLFRIAQQLHAANIAVALLRQFLRILLGPQDGGADEDHQVRRSEEHTSELQSLMRISYVVSCLQQKKTQHWECRLTHDRLLKQAKPFNKVTKN